MIYLIVIKNIITFSVSYLGKFFFISLPLFGLTNVMVVGGIDHCSSDVEEQMFFSVAEPFFTSDFILFLFFVFNVLIFLFLIFIIWFTRKIDLLKALILTLFVNWVCIYLFVLRYLRLGKDLDLISFFSNSIVIQVLIILLFFWPFASIWIRLFLWTILDIKLYFFHLLTLYLKDFHIFLLRYKYYFKIVEKLYKLSFILLSFIIYDTFIYRPFPPSLFRKSIHWSARNPLIFQGLLFLILFLEIIMRSGNLYYFQYVLFTFLVIRPILTGLIALSMSSWNLNICLADYRSGNWEHPRYYLLFWSKFPLLREMNNFLPSISEELSVAIKKQTEYCDSILHVQGIAAVKLASYTVRYPKYSLLIRHKTAYRTWSNVRWVHTSAALESASIWHPITSLFAKRGTEYAALINNHWTHFHQIERFKNRIPYYEIQYLDFQHPYKDANISISKAVEHNLLTNFPTFKRFGVIVQPFTKNLKLDSHNQARDDIIFDLSKSVDPIKDKRVHGLDQKASGNIAKTIDDPCSKIYSNISIKKYGDIIENYKQLLFYNVPLSGEQKEAINFALRCLVNSSGDQTLHAEIWLKYIHLFPNNYIPPMRVNFSTQNFDSFTKEAYQRSYQRMGQISNKLCSKNVRNDYQKAAEIFEDSEIQRILFIFASNYMYNYLKMVITVLYRVIAVHLHNV